MNVPYKLLALVVNLSAGYTYGGEFSVEQDRKASIIT